MSTTRLTTTRLITLDDAPVITDLVTASREFLAPWEPARSENFFTVGAQRAVIEAALAKHAAGAMLPHVILNDDGQVAGRINLNDIVHGAFENGHLGYWVSAAEGGRGLATAAVREIIDLAFGPLGLHRIQAGTLLHNVRSQRVLERTGFVRYAMAPTYLKIDGQWQDHYLYQLINPAPM
ncbi:MAG TPA: GNAT family protein [Streptosporangiaceae bacterium]|jgi:ribosomal-protein-alanine N-acetyltransferase